MCLSAVPWSTSQITLAQRQSYNKTRPLNHISTAFYRPTPQLRHYETVYHTEMCVRICVCARSGIVCEQKRQSGRRRMCVLPNVAGVWAARRSIWQRFIFRFYYISLALLSPLLSLRLHHTHTSVHTQPSDHWLTGFTRTFWLVSWPLFQTGRGHAGWLSFSN